MDSRSSGHLESFRANKNKGVLVVALVGAFLYFISLFVPLPPTAHIGPIARALLTALNVFQILLYLSLIVAQKKGSRLLYLPYLFVQGIALLYLTLMFMASAALMIVAPQSWIDKINKEHPEYEMTKFKFRCIFALGALSIGLGMAMIGLFYAIVYRAYKSLKEGHDDDDDQKLLTKVATCQ